MTETGMETRTLLRNVGHFLLRLRSLNFFIKPDVRGKREVSLSSTSKADSGFCLKANSFRTERERRSTPVSKGLTHV